MKFRLAAILTICTYALFGQCDHAPIGSAKVARNYSNFGQYTCALEEYLKLHREKPSSIKFKRAIAECYFNIPGSEHKAIPFLNALVKKKKMSKEDYYILATAYHQKEEFDSAIVACNEFLKSSDVSEVEKEAIAQLIGYCKNGKELKKFPLSIKFENIGEKVNSKYDDINPLINSNEGELFFTTTRKYVMGGYTMGNGYIPDIFMTTLKGKRYSKPRSMGTMFNTIDVDEYGGSSYDGKYFFYSTDADGVQLYNIKMSHKAGKRARRYPKPTPLVGINGTTSNEKTATINADGTVIIFSSDREGGQGGYDLWISRKLPNGEWGIPINLGPTINTPYDDLFAQFNEGDSSIHFASQGHLSMGGFDIFKSSSSNDYKDWSQPVNLGYPVNTVNNDYTIKYIQKNRIAYKSDYREDSYGLADIYRLSFLDSTPQLSVLNIQIDVEDEVKLHAASLMMDNDTSKMYLDSLVNYATIESVEDSIANAALIDSVKLSINERTVAIDKCNPNCFAEIYVNIGGEEIEYGQYKSNPIKGGVLMILEPGSYDLSVQAEGYKLLNKSVVIYDKTRFKPFLKNNFLLKKK